MNSFMGEGRVARFARVKHPVARDEGLLVEHLSDETVVYDDRTSEAHCLSPLAAVVFDNCDGETTIEQLGARASERLGEPVDEPRVIEALVQLQDRDLLAVPPGGGLSRRQMIGKSAAAAGAFAGASLITSIVAPAAVAQASKTCGELLCCACCQEEAFNKDECCESPIVFTSQCECTGIRDNDTPVVGTGKYCKPSGNAAPDDEFCEALYGGPAGRQAHCLPLQTHTGGGGAGCSSCVAP